MKKCVLKNFVKLIRTHLCCLLQACNFIKKETLTQVFSCEFCKIFKNTFQPTTTLLKRRLQHRCFKEHLRLTASVNNESIKGAEIKLEQLLNEKKNIRVKIFKK